MLPRKFVRVVRVVYSTLSRNGSQRRVPETVLQAWVPCPRAEPANAARNMVAGSEAKEPRGHLVNLLHVISGEEEAPGGEAGLPKVHPALSRLSVTRFFSFHGFGRYPSEVCLLCTSQEVTS